MKIGNIELPYGAILAPMAGYTEAGFRAVCAREGAVMTVTEMISAKGLLMDGKNTLELLQRNEFEKICAVQLFGHEPDVMAEAVLSDFLKPFDIIDINMGCPVRKVVKNGAGCALMKNPALASKIISGIKKNAGKRPVTVKFRMGWSKNLENYVEFGKMCEASGADAVTLHSRFGLDYYSGNALKNAWSKLKESVNIPVIANGDIREKPDFQNAMNFVDGVMIGRGALGRPQLFGEIRGFSSGLSVFEIIEAHISELKKYFDDEKVAINFRKHISHYLKGVYGGREVKAAASKITSTNELLALVKSVL